MPVAPEPLMDNAVRPQNVTSSRCSAATVMCRFSTGLPANVSTSANWRNPSSLSPRPLITVTYKGESVEGASVLLSPKSGKYSAAGITDGSGNAVMKTNATFEGVVAGDFLATVTKLEDTGYVAPPEPEDPEEWAAWEEELKNQPKPKHLLPEKYTSFDSAGLTLTVSEGSPVEETFELTD